MSSTAATARVIDRSDDSQTRDGAERAPAGVGGRLVSREGRELPLRAVKLDVRAGGGIARAVVEQTFVNDSDEPLSVHYLLPIPADGAVSGVTMHVWSTMAAPAD